MNSTRAVIALMCFSSTAVAQKGPWWLDAHAHGGRVVVELPTEGEVVLELVSRADTPETDTPETDTPETDAPGTDAPETDAPETDAPETDTPETDAPETDTPETEADSPETAVLRFSSSGVAAPDGGVLHMIDVEGLNPDTAYVGRLHGPGFDEEVTFHTAPVETDRFLFLAYGDDRTGHATHRALVAHMQTEEAARFVIHTGDYVEVGGRPSDWQAFFDIAQPLLRRVPIYPTLGNHEIYGPGGRRRYQRYFVHHDRRVAWQAWTHGPIRLITLDSNDEWVAEGEQQQWLDAELESARDHAGVRFVIVFAHHGPVSSGRHGDHEGMAALRIADRLRDAGVDLFLSGHDHMYERGDREGLKYIVTGGGGAPLYRVNRRLPSQQSFQIVHHYLRFEVVGERLNMEAVAIDGAVFERCGFVAGGTWDCQVSAPIDPGEPPASQMWMWLLLVVAATIAVGAYGWRRLSARKSSS